MPGDENLDAQKMMSAPVHDHKQETRAGHEAEGKREHGHIEPFELFRIAVTAIIAVLVLFRVWEPFPQVSVVGIAGVLFGR